MIEQCNISTTRWDGKFSFLEETTSSGCSSLEEASGFLISLCETVFLFLLYHLCGFLPFTFTIPDFGIDIEKNFYYSLLKNFIKEYDTELTRFVLAVILALSSSATVFFMCTIDNDVIRINIPIAMAGLFLALLSAVLAYDQNIPASRRLSRVLFVMGLLILFLGISSIFIDNYINTSSVKMLKLGAGILVLHAGITGLAYIDRDIVSFGPRL